MELSINFVSITCCYTNCGITWAHPSKYDQEKRRDHTIFYCPNGHPQSYPGQSDLEKVQVELTKTKEKLTSVKNCAEHKKHRITALKGVITKMKKAKG